MKKLYHPKLFVGNLHNTDLPLFGQVELGTPYVNVRIFSTGTKPKINTELEHLAAIIQQLFPKKRSCLSVFSGFGRKVKKYEYPHASVLVESREMVGFHCLNNDKTLQFIGVACIYRFSLMFFGMTSISGSWHL